MIGIYIWKNRINNKTYVGQSIDIERRKKQHLYSYKTKTSIEYDKALYRAMRKYGIENFDFSVVEECDIKDLNEKECYWMNYFDSYKNGYNEAPGGSQIIGSSNPRTKLTEQDVLTIRQRIHQNNEYAKDVYEDYKHLVGYDSFWSLAHGNTWKNVDSSMIKEIKIDNNGSKNPRAKLKEKDVEDIRKRRYIDNEKLIDIYQDYKERVSYSTFEKVVRGETWKKVPMPTKVNTCID